MPPPLLQHATLYAAIATITPTHHNPYGHPFDNEHKRTSFLPEIRYYRFRDRQQLQG